MLAECNIGEKRFLVDFEQPIDISIPLVPNQQGVNCFYAPWPEASPVIAGSFKGSVQLGGPVNFMNVKINPHGNGTHTETVGHISAESYPIRDCLREFTMPALLISVYPTRKENGDGVIEVKQLELWHQDLMDGNYKALIVRTLPNEEDKCYRNYSGTNPVYFSEQATVWMVDRGIEHLLTDLPSIDREEDGGALKAHKAFWQYPEQVRKNCTITELVFVSNSVKDGVYLLQLQTGPFYLDVSPARPVLYNLQRLK